MSNKRNFDQNWPDVNPHTQSIIVTYLTERSAILTDLMLLKSQDSSERDEFFKAKRELSEKATRKTQDDLFFPMMRGIALEIDLKSRAFHVPGPQAQVLDLGMAPGGFSKAVLDINSEVDVQIAGMCLPEGQGGYPFSMQLSSSIHVLFEDLTMLIDEFGVEHEDIPVDHEDKGLFKSSPLPATAKFDLVIADAAISWRQERSQYRKNAENMRLVTSQLMIALNHVKPGGTLVIRLHKPHAWHCIQTMHFFSTMSTIELVKPAKVHRLRGSFYMVARSIDVGSDVARQAMDQWRRDWLWATLSSDKPRIDSGSSEDKVRELLNEFGEQLVKLANPIWEIQRAALAKQPWLNNNCASNNSKWPDSVLRRKEHLNQTSKSAIQGSWRKGTSAPKDVQC